eukprot:c684_g1_i2.p1 GENE.c684_g1_i2~~c684_g1_i2.p1  ORF type:complete len:537 (+),score=104.39 c684_g1_i2:51-1613(+)
MGWLEWLCVSRRPKDRSPRSVSIPPPNFPSVIDEEQREKSTHHDNTQNHRNEKKSSHQQNGRNQITMDPPKSRNKSTFDSKKGDPSYSETVSDRYASAPVTTSDIEREYDEYSTSSYQKSRSNTTRRMNLDASLGERVRETSTVPRKSFSVSTDETEEPSTRRKRAESQQSLSRNTSNASREAPRGIRTNCLVGLRNLGNTCYLNSILQCLHKTPNIHDVLSSVRSPEPSVAAEFVQTMEQMQQAAELAVISPTSLKREIGRRNRRFASSQQQDSQEFLRVLLDMLHEDCNRNKGKRLSPIDEKILDEMEDRKKSRTCFDRYREQNDSPFSAMFCGQLKSSVVCEKCRFVSTCFDVFWDLSLPIPARRHVTLEECLGLFTQEEVLDGSEKVRCAKCKKPQRCTKAFKICRLPNILVLHLKRFSAHHSYSDKVQTPITFPKTLDLSNFVALTDGSSSCYYECFGVSNHIGSTVSSGHYTAHCLHPTQKRWYLYDDSRVREEDWRSICQSNQEAFVLFYVRV